MLSNNNRSSESSSSEEDMDQETPSNKQHPSEEEQTVVDANIMPAKPSDKEQSFDEASESEKNIMPQQNINGNPSSAAKDDVDMDLEKIMEESTFLAKESESCSTSSSSNSSSSSSTSGEETSSEQSSFICSTATCGTVFDTAAGLRAHERNIVVDGQKMAEFTVITQDASNIMVRNMHYNVIRRIHMITLENFFIVLNVLPKGKTA